MLAARRAVCGAWRRQGESAGVRPVAASLAGRVPNWLVRDLLAQIKVLHRAHEAYAQSSRRVSVAVRARDVMWSMDATHLARLTDGVAVEGQVVRETSTPKILAVEVGAATDTARAVALLRRVARERGALPLVLATDNGPAYTSEDFERWLARRGVVHLLSMPHTPRHNPWVERTNGELKAETHLGRGVVVNDVGPVRDALDAARCRLDEHRLRATLGFQTAAAADARMPRWYDATTRERFLATVCRHIAEALPGLRTERARRAARREAVYAAMEELGLVQRTRGGR